MVLDGITSLHIVIAQQDASHPPKDNIIELGRSSSTPGVVHLRYNIYLKGHG
jgi:hypothetical protein